MLYNVTTGSSLMRVVSVVMVLYMFLLMALDARCDTIDWDARCEPVGAFDSSGR